MPDKIEKDHWHPGFLGAMEIEFRAYRPNQLDVPVTMNACHRSLILRTDALLSSIISK